MASFAVESMARKIKVVSEGKLSPRGVRLLDRASTPSYPGLYISIDWVRVGGQRHLKPCRSLRELDNQGKFCFFPVVGYAGGRVRSFVRGGEPSLRTRGMIASRSVYGKAPKR